LLLLLNFTVFEMLYFSIFNLRRIVIKFATALNC